jgi:hypothetical protein
MELIKDKLCIKSVFITKIIKMHLSAKHKKCISMFTFLICFIKCNECGN